MLSEADAMPERNAGASRDAAAFLLALLKDGALPADEVRAHADGSGLSWVTVRRAQKALGIVPRREGYGSDGRWLWSLPGH